MLYAMLLCIRLVGPILQVFSVSFLMRVSFCLMALGSGLGLSVCFGVWGLGLCFCLVLKDLGFRLGLAL